MRANSISATTNVFGPPAPSNQTVAYGLLLLVCLPLLISFISPLFSWCISLLVLAAASPTLSQLYRRMLGLVVVFSGAVIISSRQVFMSLSDDFGNYLETYHALAAGNMDALFNYGQGFEVGLPLLFKLHSLLLPNAEPSSVIFFVSFVCGVLFLLWLEKYGIAEIKASQKSLCVATSLTFFSFFLTSQVMRQMIAMIFILFALFSKEKSKTIILVMVASSFHLTALPIFIAARSLFRWPKTSFVLLSTSATLFSTMFPLIISLYSSGILDFAGSDKLSYYIQGAEGFTAPDLSMLNYIVVLLGVYLFIHSKNNQRKEWRFFVLAFSVIFIVMLPFPLAPLRTTLILNAVLLGYLLFVGVKEYAKPFTIVLSAYIIYRTLKMAIEVTGGNGFDLWYSFSWIGYPFYYWID